MKKYKYSDLVIENIEFDTMSEFSLERKNIKSGYKEYESGAVKVCSLKVDSEAESKRYNCRRGKYVTLSFDRRLTDPEQISNCVAEQIRECLSDKLKEELNYNTRILVVGLGNIDMTADSIGPRTLKKITVTGHISCDGGDYLKALRKCKVFAFSSGVAGDTGMESASSVKGIVSECDPDAIIVIDSLAARDSERLSSTVQITDNGISPGSGIYNARREISEQTMGVPVIALGVPTVIDSATLVCKAIEDAGIEKLSKELERSLEAQRRFFVAPKDCDLTVRAFSSILASAIDKALTV